MSVVMRRRPENGQHEEKNVVMETALLDFRQETMKALWHAFHMLDMAASGSVHVSQLKVITSTIGSKLGINKAEQILNRDKADEILIRDEAEEIPNHGNKAEEIPNQENKAEEIPNQENKAEESSKQDNKTEEIPNQGNKAEEIPSQGNKAEEIPNQGNKAEESSKQDNKTEEIPNQGNEAEEIPKQGNKGEEIHNKNKVESMDFETYFDIVKNQLLDKQEINNTDENFLETRLNAIIKTCYTFCNFERLHHCKSFTTEHCIVLWRLYNFLADTNDEGEPAVPVYLHPEEAALLLRGFIDITGQKNKETQVRNFLTEKQDTLLSFSDFLNVFEKDYVAGLSNKNITIGLNHLYDTYIKNILMKGKIRKRGFKVKTWKDRWLVLTPTRLRYFVGSDEKILKGTIEFDSECTLEVPPDRPTHKPNRFAIHTQKKPYELSALDLKSKNEWVSAIELALSRVGKNTNLQKEAARERCMARAKKRHLAAEEERRRQAEADLLKSRECELDEQKRKRLEDEELLRSRLNELEEERRRREEAEARWQEEQALREAEQQRLRELEEIKRELERLLAEERQAKKDEEIVRNLQSKLLEEEFEKREELERLKQLQEEMLRAEREQKAVLESDRKEQERLLAEAKARLEQLELDKAAAAEKMQEAAEKLQKAEKDRHIMEEKVKLWKTPVGLARPILPHPEPLVTHRGLGAFCEKDFVKKQPSIDGNVNTAEVSDANKVSDVSLPEDEKVETAIRSDAEDETSTECKLTERNSAGDANGNYDSEIVQGETQEKEDRIQFNIKALDISEDSEEMNQNTTEETQIALPEDEPADSDTTIIINNSVNHHDLQNQQSDGIFSTDVKSDIEKENLEEEMPKWELDGNTVTNDNSMSGIVTE